MSYLHLTHKHSTSRSPSPSFRPLTRRDTKRSRIITLSDDEDADDYPYSSTHRPVRSSRELTVRNQPSQLERYNIWSDRYKTPERDEEREVEVGRAREWKYTSSGKDRHHRRYEDVDDDELLKCDPEERLFRLKLRATFEKDRHHHHHQHSPSSSHHHHHHHTSLLPSPSFRIKDKFLSETLESRSRSRSRSHSRRRDSFWGEDGFWGDSVKKERDCERDSEDETDEWRRMRRVKRTRTEEWRPLTGWRRL